MAEIKSVPSWKCISPKQISVMIANKDNGFGNSIYVQIPRIKNPIPLFILFRALGVNADKEICKRIILNIEDERYKKMLFALKASIIDANKHTKYEDALEFIISNAMFSINMDKETGIQKKKKFTISVLENDLFPHCKTKQEKIYFLGYMVNKLLRTKFGWRKVDDRDSYKNKRVDLTGTLLNNLLEITLIN